MLEFFLLGKSLKSYTLSKLAYFLLLNLVPLTILVLFASTREEMMLLTFSESFLELSLFYF